MNKARATFNVSASALFKRVAEDISRAESAPSTSRRFVALSLALAAASTASAPGANAQKFKEVCDPTEDGAECRANILAQDGIDVGAYEVGGSRSFKAANPTGAKTSLTTYQSDTLEFVGEVEALLAMDVYDGSREKAVAAFQKKSNNWSGKYAPGGSSKMASGRAFYNALNQLAGHYSFNGLAPIPKSRLDVVETNIAKTKELIAAGR